MYPRPENGDPMADVLHLPAEIWENYILKQLYNRQDALYCLKMTCLTLSAMITSRITSNKFDVVQHSVSSGAVSVLKFFLSTSGQPYPFDEKTSTLAASGGHLEVLKHLREKGCSWDAETSSAAARGGHLDVVKWALQNGCPRYHDMCQFAARDGHLKTLQWLYRKGHVETFTYRWGRTERRIYNIWREAARGGQLVVILALLRSLRSKVAVGIRAKSQAVHRYV